MKSNNYIPYGRQTIDNDDIDAVIEVLKSSFLTQGPNVQQFEEIISEKVTSNYTIAVNSATSALHIACLALGLEKGDILWTTPITFVASANCALYCGASIDFVDIKLSTGLIDINALEKKLEIAKKTNSLPKIVIPVHLAGTSCEMYEIKRLSELYGFYIIEDASHAIGATYDNHAVGSCKYSDITVFSFHPVKIITTGEGGCCTTNKKSLAESMYKLRSHGITKNTNEFVASKVGPWHYEQQILGFNYRLSDIHAALGISQTKKLKTLISKRHIIMNKYLQELVNLPLCFLSQPSNTYSSLHLAILRLTGEAKKDHSEFFNYLRSNNIGVQLHYSPVHLQPYYRNLGFNEGDFPNAEIYGKSAISIPIYPTMTEENQSYIIHKIKKYYIQRHING